MDFLDKYFAYVQDTEPPKIFYLWSLVAGISALTGRKIWFKNGSMTIFPNLYVMLIGSPGTRKSTAIKKVKKVMKASGYNTFAADRSSKQKFLLDLEAGFDFECMADTGLASDKVSKLLGSSLDDLLGSSDTGPHEVCIAADEFNDFFGLGNTDFAALLGVLWDIEDSYSDRLKNSKSVNISEPTVSLLGGNTHEGFKLAFPPELLGQGFMSRLILVYGESSGKKITFPKDDDEEKKAELANHMALINSTELGRATCTEEAATMLDEIYQSWEDLDDARFRYYSTRRFTQLIKLCLTLTAAKLSNSIDAETVLLANTMLTHAELYMPQALGEYGKAKNAEILHKIMDIFNHAVRALNIKDIWTQVANDLDNMSILMQLMQGLIEADKIQRVEGGYLPKKKIKAKGNLKWVDFTLLHRFGIFVH